MNTITKFLALCVMLIASVSIASATPITGSITISGTDTLTSTGIGFDYDTGLSLLGSGSLSSFNFRLFDLNGFNFNSTAAGTTLFTGNAGVQQLSFVIGSILSATTTRPFGITVLDLVGTGTFYEINRRTGQSIFAPTAGNFTLNSVGGVYFLTSTAAVTPEPSSFVLLGTGLLGAAFLMMRRRSLAL